VEFAREAVADGEGPMLDVAGGTAVFTAPVYREAPRAIVLSDLSLGMLARARERLAGAPNVTLVQADATDPPFAPGAFATVACMSALHVFPDPAAVVRAVRPLVAPGGRMFLSGLVAETGVGSRYLRFLERAGEAGPPLGQAELEAVVADAAGATPQTTRRGSMAYMVLAPD
jgi:ubiquinone/menaquinone biosynthesis C-methylase UbiE